MGGGITGLAAAHRLIELIPGVQVDLFESGAELGGTLKTEVDQDFLIEHSADMFTTKEDDALKLCERIGFSDQLIGTNSEHQRAFIAQGSQLVPVPQGLNLMTPSNLESIKTTPLLSEEGKARFLAEEFVEPKTNNHDESLESFAIRRFGPEAYQRIIQPLVGGIYTADPQRLSLRSTLSQYLEMEAAHGSIIAAAKARAKTRASESETSGARYNLFVAPRLGMKSWLAALRAKLTEVNIFNQVSVTNVSQNGLDWDLQLNTGKTEAYQGVLITCPANAAARLLNSSQPGLSELLLKIEYASSAIVIHAFERHQVEHELDGFGFVVPLCENRQILAGSFASVKFAGRAQEDRVLTRTFVGGACQAQLLDQSDQEIAEMAFEELAGFLGIVGQPQLTKLVRWTGAMPQYHLGHDQLVNQIEDLTETCIGLEVAGKSYRGVGIPACVRSGEQAAQRIVESLEA